MAIATNAWGVDGVMAALPASPEIFLFLAVAYLVHAASEDIDEWLKKHPKWPLARFTNCLSFCARLTLYVIAALYLVEFLHASDFGGTSVRAAH